MSVYLEVKGYGEATQWVYGQAPDPGECHDGGLLTLQEVRECTSARCLRSGASHHLLLDGNGRTGRLLLILILVPIASLIALRAAARLGRLDAHVDSEGEWLSTRKAVDAYKSSRAHHGRSHTPWRGCTLSGIPGRGEDGGREWSIRAFL